MAVRDQHTAGRTVGQIGDDERAALERDVTTAWRTFLDGDALRLDLDAVLTTARK